MPSNTSRPSVDDQMFDVLTHGLSDKTDPEERQRYVLHQLSHVEGVQTQTIQLPRSIGLLVEERDRLRHLLGNAA